MKRLWPFVLKRTFDRWVSDTSSDMAKMAQIHATSWREIKAAERHAIAQKMVAEKIAKAADDKMTSMQLSFTRIMEEKYDPSPAFRHLKREWPKVTERILELVDPCAERTIYAAMTQPTMDVEQRTMERVKMVRFSVNVGLSRECAPELIVTQVMRQIEAAIMAKWREQSILLKAQA